MKTSNTGYELCGLRRYRVVSKLTETTSFLASITEEPSIT